MKNRGARTVVVLLLCLAWAPGAGFMQLAGYIGVPLIVYQALRKGIVVLVKRDAMLLGAAFGTATFVALLHTDTGIINPALGLLTYSPICLLAVRFVRADDDLIVFTANAIAYMSIGQAVLGFTQLFLHTGGTTFDLAAGDSMLGTTKAKFSHLYALLMLYQGTFLAALLIHIRKHRIDIRTRSRQLWLIACVLSFLSTLFASFISGVALFLLGFVVWTSWSIVKRWIAKIRAGRYVVNKRSIVMSSIALATFVFLSTVLVYTQSANITNAIAFSRRLSELSNGQHPHLVHPSLRKIAVMRQSFSEVLFSDPITATFGLGLGRHSSRAAMILTGDYLANHPDIIPVSMSPQTRSDVLPYWTQSMKSAGGGSVLAMPFSSVQAIVTEFGLLGLLFLSVYFSRLIQKSLRIAHCSVVDNLHCPLLRIIPIVILTVVFIGIMDVFFEFRFIILPYLTILLGASGLIAKQQTFRVRR